MLLVNLRRVLKSGLLSFWRNSYVAMASIFVMTITLFVIGSLMLGMAFLENTLNNIEQQVDVSVSFNSQISDRQVMEVKEKLEDLPEVASVTYISAEDELNNFRKRHQDDIALLQSLEEIGNPFGSRLNVSAVDPSEYLVVTNYLKQFDQTLTVGGQGLVGQEMIDKVSYKEDIIEKLLAVIDTSRTVSLAIAGVLIIMSVLVTFNTISLAIYISREEISVMKLVGASNAYIRGPFIIEGLLAGVIAAFLAMALLYPASIWVANATVGVYGGINLVAYYVDSFSKLFLTLLGSGMALGVVSGLLAIRKFLKA
ncbi:MAG: permease-like cell division protein FtsX [Patescibacteria group bacterium]